MEKLAEQTVGEVVVGNFRTASVFTNYGIDFCCGGNIGLSEACQKKEVNLEELLLALQKVNSDNTGEQFAKMEASELIAHIVNVHHAYVERSIPTLKLYLAKLEKVHFHSHPELKDIHRLFVECAAALTVHMKKEELVLFPYIKSMEKAKKEGVPLPTAHFGHIDHPIHMMEEDHEAEGARFAKISELTQGYSIPDDACSTYRVTYQMLEEFEKDLHTHIHLENNILFPKAQSMFANLTA